MTKEYHRVLLLFIDGIGLAPAAAGNPFAELELPAIASILGAPMTLERVDGREDDGRELRGRGLHFGALDANLGVAGLPQSATGQTTLFTGRNAAAHLGRHLSAYPGPRLKELIGRHGLFLRARRAGRSATFANAYTRRYVEALESGTARASVTTHAVLSAGLELRDEAALERGEAVAWDVTRSWFRRRAGLEIDEIDAEVAGRQLARLAAGHHLTVFETFLTDLAGHRRLEVTPRAALERLDGLLAGLISEADEELTIVLTSDHGNLEEAGGRSHTRNPVPLLAVGRGATALVGCRSLVDVTPALLELLATAVGDTSPS